GRAARDPGAGRGSPPRWRGLFSRRPARPRDRRRSIRRRSLSSTAATVERRWLLDGMPLLLVGRDPRPEDVLVVPKSAAAVILRGTFLDPDFAGEDHALEVLELDRASGTRLRAHVVGLEAAYAIEDRLERAAADVGGLGMSVRGANYHEVLPKLALGIRSIDESKLNVEHLAAAILAALEQPVLADTAGTDMKRDVGNRPVRDQLKLRRRGIGVVVHGAFSYG